jgi:acyl-CoA synthetase (NDP forming)
MFADARRAFVQRGIPVFNTLSEGLRAIGHLNAYYGRKRS